MTFQLSHPVYLVDGVRTPFLRASRQPGPFSATDLANAALRALLARQPVPPEAIGEVILGCVLPAPQEVNIARIAALRAGLPRHVPAFTVNRVCGSGLQAIDAATRAIATGAADVMLAGGVESMSHAPHAVSAELASALATLQQAATDEERLAILRQLPGAALRPRSAMMCALSDTLENMRMGDTAEVLVRRFGLSRAEQDAFALASHRRAQAAWEQGHFRDEVIAMRDAKGTEYTRDTGIRPDTSLDKLASLGPVFDPRSGSVTAGNSSQITDGAAALLLAGEQAVRRYGLTPLARIVAITWAGLNPREMGLGPAFAIARLIREAGLKLEEVDIFEINEAFAAQVLACTHALADDAFCREELGLPQRAGAIDSARLNIDGGAIALGHPLGASGARIVLHLARAMQRTKARRGLAALCIGGGQGGALLLQHP